MKIGLTGGIGSGKTAVGNVFASFGIPVFNADTEAKLLYKDPELISWIKDNISCEVINKQNQVDTKRLAHILFTNNKKLRLLETKVHPMVYDRFRNWYLEQAVAPYVLYEAAILFETGRFKQLDKNILVVAPEKLRIERIKKRDNLSISQIEQRLVRQWGDDKKIPLADFVISNIDWPETLIQIKIIHEKISKGSL